MFVHVPKAKRKNWDPKAIEKGNLLVIMIKRKYTKYCLKIVIHRYVEFVSESDTVFFSSIEKLETMQNSVEETVSSIDKEKWKAAIQEELQSMKSNKVWKTVATPSTGEILHSKWIFKVKDSGKHKARLVARGYAQKDMNLQTYAPAASMKMIQLMSSLAVMSNFIMH